MRGIDVIAMLKSVAGGFVKDSHQKISGAELNRLYVGQAPCFSYGGVSELKQGECQ